MNPLIYIFTFILLVGCNPTKKQKKEAKFFEFLSRAPISFDKGDES